MLNALVDPDDGSSASSKMLLAVETGCSVGTPAVAQAVGPNEGLAVGGVRSMRALTWSSSSAIPARSTCDCSAPLRSSFSGTRKIWSMMAVGAGVDGFELGTGDGRDESIFAAVGLADGRRVVGLAVVMLGAPVGGREGRSLVPLSDGRSVGLAEGAQPKSVAGWLLLLHTVWLIQSYASDILAYTPGNLGLPHSTPNDTMPTWTSSLPSPAVPRTNSGPPESPEQASGPLGMGDTAHIMHGSTMSS